MAYFELLCADFLRKKIMWFFSKLANNIVCNHIPRNTINVKKNVLHSLRDIGNDQSRVKFPINVISEQCDKSCLDILNRSFKRIKSFPKQELC